MRLTDHDASFLYTETVSGPMHGGAISIVEGEIPFDTVFTHIQDRLHLVPRYRQRLVYVPFNLAHPKWVDDPAFDLTNHVIEHRLADDSTLADALEGAMLLAEPLMPRDRPLWKTFVIYGVAERTILVQLGHHAMVDGASGIDISLILFDLQKDAPAPEPPSQPWQPAPLPSAFELTTEAAADNIVELTSFNPFKSELWSEERLELLRRATESMTRFVAEPVITAPWNAAAVGPKRNFHWQKYSFGEFREIRHAFGGTINDVVLAVVAEGAARYLAHHGESQQGGHLRLMCPVNVRREDEHGALGNRVSAIFPIFSSRPKNIVDRLNKVRYETEHIKHNREAQAMELLTEAMPSTPPAAMAHTLLVGTNFDPTAFAAQLPLPVQPGFGQRPPLLGFNFTCTNVPGVQVAQYIAGHKVLDVLGVLMLSGTLGYGVAVGSYNQQLYFNFVCDPRLMPDIEAMASEVDGAFSELLEAARDQATET